MKILARTAALLILATGLAAPALAARDKGSANSQAFAPQLGPNARGRYAEIFGAIRSQQWADAAAKLDAMPEGPLHNVARAELYLAKGSPMVEGSALAALARKAPELPQAAAMVALASKRGAAELPFLPSQRELVWLGSQPRRGKIAGSEPSGIPLVGQIVPLLKNDQPNEAEAVLEANRAALDPYVLTEWQARIAWTYFLTGDDLAARRLATAATSGIGDWAPQASWVAGLTAWRQKDFAAAAQYFDDAARRHSDAEMVAAANFWGSRALMMARQPEKVDAKLRAAARNPETFYGLLAMQQLGLKAAPEAPRRLDNVEELPNVRAALALAEIGERDLAEELIRHQARIGNPQDHAALAELAGRLDLPTTQLWLAHNGPSGATAPVSARYPAPHWQPASGWRVDRALAYAHALQESRFNPKAVSPVGARGLMQVMPATAAGVARRRGDPQPGPLNDPSVNLEYGQTYLETLRDMSETGGLLPKIVAAYNAGPLPVGNWNFRARDNGDPLLYIESIPYWETRAYVATVLRNYWIYQLKAGESTNSLAALAQGMWPRFPGLPGAQAVRLDRTGGTASAD